MFAWFTEVGEAEGSDPVPRVQKRKCLMWQPADYKLSDMLSIAGATIGIIIAGAILMGNVIARYIAIFERYRALTGEYRDNHFSDQRRGGLKNQICNYALQITYLHWGS